MCSIEKKILKIQRSKKKKIFFSDFSHFQIDITGASLLSLVEQRDKILAARVRRYLEKSKELVGIETNLRLQLSKLNERIKEGAIDIVSRKNFFSFFWVTVLSENTQFDEQIIF